MIAAIAGDIIGSVHERANIKRTNFELFKQNSRFTDDTTLTVAVADAVMNRKPYAATIRDWGRRYPDRGYGGMFREWLKKDDAGPYGSFGNGGAMRVSPVGFAFDKLGEVLDEAERSAAVTHDHPEGIKGAQAVAAAIFLARQGKDKKEIKRYVESQFKYDLSRHVDQIRKTYEFDVTSQGSVPESIISFLDSDDVESAIRLGISLGGDADTIACIAGGIAQAYYKQVPETIVRKVQELLTPEMWELTQRFSERYRVAY